MNRQLNLLFVLPAIFWFQVAIHAEDAKPQQAKDKIQSLLDVVVSGDAEAVQKALVLYKDQLNQAGAGGQRALHVACSKGNLPAVEKLLAAGADVKIQNDNGETPLHLAVTNEHEDVVKRLLKAGADINQADKKGQSPVFLASVVLQNLKIAGLLVEAGVNPKRAGEEPEQPITSFGSEMAPARKAPPIVENKDFGFRAKAPKDWSQLANQQDTVFDYNAVVVLELPAVHSDIEKQDIKNAVCVKAFKMKDGDDVAAVVKKYKTMTEEGRKAIEEKKDESGVFYEQTVENNGLTYKTQFRARFANGFGYVIEFVATPGAYDKNLPAFLEFERSVELFKPK